MRTPLHVLLSVLAAALVLACDSGGGGAPDAGTITLGPDQGVDFRTGRLMDPGNFDNSDLFATANGSALKLSTGGPSPTASNPANWFRTAGGLYQTFASLDEVPAELPPEDASGALVKAHAGNGFVVKTHAGDYVRGWLAAADEASVTIEWDRVDAARP